MKVLILVQSIEHGRYPELIKTQKETWDSVKHPQVQTLFYIPTLDKPSGVEGDMLYINEHPTWKFMYTHFMRACVYSLKYEWDYIFKTDNSSYVCKEELVKILESKPREKLYAGELFSQRDPEVIKKLTADFMWGEGYVLSRDLVIKLVDKFAINPHSKLGADDTILGYFLKSECIPDPTMHVCKYYEESSVLPKSHVYRCAQDDVSKASKFDDEIKAMQSIHKQLVHENISVSNVV